VRRQARAFWWLASLLAFFLASASAPSPLYSIYQATWHFSAATLTVVYGVYALGALAALLITGNLSDRVGRRPVTAVGLVIQLLAMAAFLVAGEVEMLVVARLLQGFATGMAAAALSAWLIDLQPADNPRLGSVVAGAALLGGLGAGALVSGVIVDAFDDPLHTVFWLQTPVFALGLASIPLVPDVVERSRDWIESLRPRVAIPGEARRSFWRTSPSMIAVWAIGGFYLALGPSLAASLLKTTSHVAGGAVIAALLVTAAASAYFAGRRDGRQMLLLGSVVLAVGVLLTLGAIAAESFVGLLAATVVTGIGFGPAFSSILRIVTAAAPAKRRGALVAALYVELYLSFSVPTIAAGVAIGAIGLLPATYAYGLIVIVLAGLSAYLAAQQRGI
jgi:MFS family permease